MFLPCQVDQLDLNYNWTIINTDEEGMVEASFEQQSNKEEVRTCLVTSTETTFVSDAAQNWTLNRF